MNATLDYFQNWMGTAVAEGIDAGTVVREARRLARMARDRVLPDFVARQFRTLDSMTRMIEDPATRLDSAARDRLLATFAYVANPNDMIPDATPETGLLDDAIVVEFVARELHTEIERFEAIEQRAMYARIARRREQRARRGGLFAIR